MKRTILYGFLFLIVLAISNCGMGYKVTKVAVQSFELQKSNIAKEKAISSISGIFVDRGFDIKHSDKDAGIVTTEFKKFASAGENPPFDFYMQIKATVRPKNGKMRIRLSPIIRAQNRLNSAAYTDDELVFYKGDQKTINYIESMKPNTGVRAKAMVIFNNVVKDVAANFGVSFEDIVQNVTETPKVLSIPEAYSIY